MADRLIMLLAVLIVVAIWAWVVYRNADRARERERRMIEGRCRRCGQNLRGIGGDDGPECGAHRRPVA